MNNFVRKIFAIGLEGSFIEQKIIKSVIITVFSYLAIIALGFYSIIGIIRIEEKGTSYVIAMTFFFLLTVFNLIWFYHKKNFVLASHFVTSLMTLLAFALSITYIGTGITGLFWLYVYAPFAIFILGRITGTIYTSIVFISILIYFQIPEETIKSNPLLSFYPQYLHSRFIFSYIIATSFPIIFEAVRHRTYSAFKKADAEKSNYLATTLNQNEEISAQKEELLAVNDELNSVNTQLEKLSIVAREADNAVVILDKNADIEWANEGFYKLYGYTIDELIKEKGRSFFKISKNTKVEEAINNCVFEHKTSIYETSAFSKNRGEIWVQTTLTPIMSANNEVSKIIAIDADISKLKDAENEIKLKNKEITKQKETLEFINSEVQSSIEYASTIQQAILPDITEMNEAFGEHFALYKPKDIVSGDFYWLSTAHEKYYFLASVDCTGHGVPGAFMSMIGSRLLNNIVNENNITDPSKILLKLDEGVKKSLKQEKSKNRDGMDVCLVRFNKTDNLENITFAGAKRPLLIYRAESKKVERIKGTRRTIGGGYIKAKTSDFVNTEIKLNKNDIIYLTSDGYIDQNNTSRKRYGTKHLLEIITSISNLTMNKQKTILNNEFENWSEGTTQRDDITILGIKRH